MEICIFYGNAMSTYDDVGGSGILVGQEVLVMALIIILYYSSAYHYIKGSQYPNWTLLVKLL
jgi:hypothetical protein